MLSDRGTAIGSVLGKDDSGFVLWSQPQNQAQAVLMYLADPKSKIKPTIQNQSNHYVTLVWNVPVPAGKTVTLVYFVAQQSMPTLLTGKKLTAQFKRFKSRDTIRDLPKDIQKSIVNIRGSGIGGWDPTQPLTSLEALGIDPSATDILAIGEKTALRGTVSFSGLNIDTQYGPKPVSAGNLAAIARAGLKDHGRIFLRDGDVLSGTISAEAIKFTMNTGLSVDLKVDQIDRLVMRQMPENPANHADVVGLLETMDGDRMVLLNGDPVSFDMVTPWGPRTISLDNIQRIEATSRPIGYRVITRDGSHLFGFLKSESLALKTRSFGVQTLHPSTIRSVRMLKNEDDEEFDADSISLPHVILKGDNLIIGDIDLERIHFLTAGQRIPVPPHQLRELQLNSDEGLAPTFQGELWDGGLIAGELSEVELPVRQGTNVAMVPVRDILEIRVPSPTVPDALRAKIRLLIRDLASTEFDIRESASRELSELGQMTRSQLTETIRLSEDPEVRRRAEALLDELD